MLQENDETPGNEPGEKQNDNKTDNLQQDPLDTVSVIALYCNDFDHDLIDKSVIIRQIFIIIKFYTCLLNYNIRRH